MDYHMELKTQIHKYRLENDWLVWRIIDNNLKVIVYLKLNKN